MDLFNYKRRLTTDLRVGNLSLGGNFPVRVQTMANTSTNDVEGSVAQCIRAMQAGSELMRYTSLRQENGVTYITLSYNQEIDRTVTYQNGVFTFNDPAGGEGATVSYPAADNCVAVDVTQPYHQIDAPQSTGSTYHYCYPSIENGEVTVIYYTGP